MRQLIVICVLICGFSLSADADDFRIPKEQFYTRVNTLAITPSENTIWESIVGLINAKDPFFSIWLFTYSIDYQKYYGQLGDQRFLDSIKTVTDSLVFGKIQSTNRFVCFPPALCKKTIDSATSMLPVRSRNPFTSYLYREYRSVFLDSVRQKMNADAMLISGYQLQFSKRGFAIAYQATILDTKTLDTLWQTESEMSQLNNRVNATRIFYEDNVESAVKSALKSIKKK